jgi:hypothetical protein
LKDGFRQREQEIIEFTRRDCEKAAAVERQNLQQEYDEKLDGLQQQYDQFSFVFSRLFSSSG